MTTHDLKISDQYFMDVADGLKTFEIRKNDRDYRVGDELRLREWIGQYTGAYMDVRVTYITDYMQQPGYVVLGIEVLR